MRPIELLSFVDNQDDVVALAEGTHHKRPQHGHLVADAAGALEVELGRYPAQERQRAAAVGQRELGFFPEKRPDGCPVVGTWRYNQAPDIVFPEPMAPRITLKPWRF